MRLISDAEAKRRLATARRGTSSGLGSFTAAGSFEDPAFNSKSQEAGSRPEYRASGRTPAPATRTAGKTSNAELLSQLEGGNANLPSLGSASSRTPASSNQGQVPSSTGDDSPGCLKYLGWAVLGGALLLWLMMGM